ncbi:MAG TPA: bifunctional riboflavin kinase/FAD synthetase [Bacteroidales bacterium]|nr:bifunctional riboflavin kinase/FAD synthetase [Bacteroidales bacterium]
MIVHKGYEVFSLVKPVVTLGIFDGVHKGHIALINSLKKRAVETGGESVVVTFSPHPRHVLEPRNRELSLLTTIDEKINLLETTGVDHLIILDFNKDLSEMEACDFVSEILMKKIGARQLIMGYDHHFGKRGEGDINRIRQCQVTSGLIIEQADGIIYDGKPISSSVIRSELLNGRIEEGNNLLGYRYFLSGNVVEGRKIGRSFGFPTANIKPCDDDKLVPANGVYAVKVLIEGMLYNGMLSIGTNPTVNNDRNMRSIEVYIIDFDREIYGKTIEIIFYARLRDEKKFPGLNELARQMEIDKQQSTDILNSNN